jgi:D-arabinose 1-dehydrogenase-like Zn-dependent alcohol dehydrogenase
VKAVVAPGVCEATSLTVQEVDDPKPRDGQVLIAVRASGVCYHDVINRTGGFPRTVFPAILGHEIAGEVVAVGSGVRQFKVGDRVATIQLQPCGVCRVCRLGRESLCRQGIGFFGEETPGGYAELVAADETALVPLPDDVPAEVGSVLACAVGTALHAIRARAKLTVGESVLITGASGGVGAHAIQIAKLAGARVFAVTSSPNKAEDLRRLGADEVIVAPDLDFGPQVKDLTGGEGVDAVLEIVGARTFPSSIKSLRVGGRLVFVGNVTAQKVSLAPAMTILKEVTITGSDACTRQELVDVIDLVRRGDVTPVIDRTLPLAEAARAHQLLEERQVKGRIVLVP